MNQIVNKGFKKINSLFGLRLAMTILCILSSVSYALPDDKQKPIELKAGIADINQETHLGTYEQQVELDQGSSHLRADHATTYLTTKNQLEKAVVYGNATDQAHFWTLTEMNKPPLHAYADIIRYFPTQHIIELEGNARVIQGSDSYSAPKIRYDTEHQHVVSSSTKEAQTVIIIHPEKKNV